MGPGKYFFASILETECDGGETELPYIEVGEKADSALWCGLMDSGNVEG